MNIRYITILLVILQINGVAAQTGQKIDSLEHDLAICKSDSFKVRILNTLSDLYRQISKFDSALVRGERALVLSKGINFRKGTCIALRNIGLVYDFQGDYPKALKYQFESLSIAEELGMKHEIAASYNNIGIIYMYQNEYDASVKYYFKAIKFHKETLSMMKEGKFNYPGITSSSIRKSLSQAYNNVGGIMFYKDDYAKAIEYYQKSLLLDRELGNNKGIAGSLNNIGGIYMRQEKNDRALENFLESNKIYQEIGDQMGLAISCNSIGTIYKLKQEYFKSIKYFEQSIAISIKVGSKEGLLYNYESVSNVYMLLGKNIRGVDNDYNKKALNYYKLYTQIKDSLFNEQKSKEFGRLEAQHEFETAEAKRQRAEEEQAKQELALKSRRDNLQYSGILIFLVLIFAGVFALGKITIPIRLAEGLIFFSFLLFFEFTLVLLDPYIEQYSSGAPAIKLGFNALLAGMIFPLHSFFEGRMKRRLVKTKT